MTSYHTFLIGLLLCFFSCKSNKENSSPVLFAPKVVEAQGYVVPRDSMAEPKVVPAGKPKVIQAGRPKIVMTNTNIHPAGIPKVVVAGIPLVCTPGQGHYALPKTISAIDSPFMAGLPEVVVAKEAYIKGQNPQNFSSYGKLQGLKHNSIMCLLEDHSGNLWIGTNGGGVSKYDGKNFAHFTEKEGLTNNVVRTLIEDKSGNIWMGTLGGVTKYDGKWVTRYTEKEGLINNNVWKILEDKNGNLWFCTEGGVCKFAASGDAATGAAATGAAASGDAASGDAGKRFTHFTENEGLSKNAVFCILEDKSGNLWFGTNGGGACKFDGKSFTHFTEKEGLSNNVVNGIIEDQDGNLWFATLGGVCIYDAYGDAASGEAGKRFIHFTVKEGLSNNIVNAILKGTDGDIWFGTFAGGVSKFGLSDYQAGGKCFVNFTTKEGLSNNDVFSILEDKRGNLWFGTIDGLSKYDLSGIKAGVRFSHFTDKEGLTNNVVRNILEDKNGNLWFCTLGGGVNKYDPADGGTGAAASGEAGASFTHYTESEGLFNNNVWCMLEDREGNFWFGTFGGGVSKFDGKTFTQFTDQEGLSSNDIRSILEDKSGNLWFGTSGAGVNKFDGKSFTQYTIKQGLSHNSVRSIVEDKSGNLWFGTGGGGVTKFDPSADKAGGKSFEHFTITEGLSNNFVWSILEDKSGNLWFGTGGGGVSKYNPSGKSFTQFTEKEGLSNNDVRSMMEDKNGNLWFGTLFGINKLEKDKLSALNTLAEIKDDNTAVAFTKTAVGPGDPVSIFKTYTDEDGFSGIGVNPGKTIFEAKDGTLWIGADDRLTAMYIEEESPDTTAPNIQLTGLALFNENMAWQNLASPSTGSGRRPVPANFGSFQKSGVKDTSILLGNGVKVHDFYFDNVSKWYGVPEHLSLAYNNNYLTFQFVGITLQTPKKIKYQYLLEGLDKNWSSLTSRNEATYGNIPDGDYTFKVKAMNGEGYWSKELSYEFNIRPPWWRTWWAYISYVLITVLVIWSYIQYRVRKLRAQKKVLEETVGIRTSQLEEKSIVLEQSLSTLKATQAQLIQSEKMASLGELTAGIAHEIQNPLNFVNNFSEINTELLDEIEDERNKEPGKRDEQSEKQILFTIRENQEKILQHGKRAEAIVKGMLQHSRSSTAIAGVKEPTEINALAEEYLQLTYQSFLAKDNRFKATLITDLDVDLPMVKAVPQDIGRVLLNLFNNAFWACTIKSRGDSESPLDFGKYTPTVTLTTKNLGKSIEIRIRDNGPGIPDHILGKIFQPFFTTKPTGQGTGLGLSLAYDVITKGHSGDIKVNSIPGVETEFIVTLPA